MITRPRKAVCARMKILMGCTFTTPGVGVFFIFWVRMGVAWFDAHPVNRSVGHRIWSWRYGLGRKVNIGVVHFPQDIYPGASGRPGLGRWRVGIPLCFADPFMFCRFLLIFYLSSSGWSFGAWRLHLLMVWGVYPVIPHG